MCVACNRAAIGGVTHPVCATRFTINAAVASIVYKGTVKKLLYNFKYKPYLSDLASVLTDLFYEGIIQKEAFQSALRPQAVLVPIPLHATKYRKRGYNQAKILAAGLGQKLSIPVVDLLKRTKNTPTQVGLPRDRRIENIKGAFAVSDKFGGKVNGATIFLVDDILTSGATMSEAAKILKKAGASKVYGLALAKDE